MDLDFDPTGVLASLGEAELEHYRALLADLGRAAGAFRFEVAPNPCVGAAVLSDGVEIGRGFHRQWGGPHAELQAFEAAAASGVPRERWDTLLVTLEPCCSQGKTPPCTEAILRTSIRRVVVGALDPDPRHRGRGLEELRERGLEILFLRGASALERYSPHFVEWTRPDRLRRSVPWVIAKWAQTRTGQLSPPLGSKDGRWISSPAAREDVHRLRARVDAILVGVGTVVADDPRLSVRGVLDVPKPPLRVILDSSLRTPPSARLFQPCQPGEFAGPVHIVARAGFDAQYYRPLVEAGAIVHALHPGDQGHTSLRETLGLLWTEGVRRVLLEGGPRLLASAFEAEYIDQLRIYTASINGGVGPSMGRFLVAERLLQIERSEVGDDARLDAFLRK
ncbi:MAG: bifunctional diaminohydroxyphosphoribosylaminopyrimidine deaminase/5-amino-6-(5-phosphoribosylamino)uracil reductase RibD [Planctomycetes bacterium]|nr:bifunctional diaminohydroxyphosphoribosylaminopyrimidine deaminase/5-amino-6-(5-phosphoribosylamino)uracil reductase RibD [Planctomycetota bacterium]